MHYHLSGLIPATFTPLNADGSLNLGQIEPMVDFLIEQKLTGLYVCGSTGEGVSLSTAERKAVAAAFVQATRGRVPVILQVGHTSLVEAQELAAHAQEIGADAISAVPPFYFKPPTLDANVRCLAQIAGAAPDLPFYYYHIPQMTGVQVDVANLLAAGSRVIPNLVGAKYSIHDVYNLQAAAELERGRFNLLFGSDEMLLSGLCAGAQGAVGTTYNFAAPLFGRVFDAFQRNDMAAAQKYQGQAVQLIRLIAGYGGLPAFKTVLKFLGFDCGPMRLPLQTLTPQKEEALKADLTSLGFFQWIA
ncbi:MAG: dihydrodipicolinate synthase family protein [Caldilineaceae bacterium]|nr:dihydrodipicolinate synthase family protein [Caldilineaceae bacterium]